MQIHEFSKYLYYPLSSFQTSMLQHSLAWYFMKKYDYKDAILLANIKFNPTYLVSILKAVRLDSNKKDAILSSFTFVYDIATYVSDLVNGVVTAIHNVTGNRTKVDPKTTLLQLAGVLNDETIIKQLNNAKEIYNNVKLQLPNATIKEIPIQISHSSYSPTGEYTIVTKTTTSINSHGQRCSNTTTTKISRNSTIQVIPILRSKVMCKDGNYVMIRLDENGKASYIDEQIKVTDKKTIAINLPTTSWDDAKHLSTIFSSNNQIVTIVRKFKGCESLESLLNKLISMTNVSFSWDSTTNIANVKIITRGLKST